MIKKTVILIPALFLAVILSGGCAHYSTDLNAFFGTGIEDLEKARAEGKEKVFPYSYDVAFEKVTEIMKKNKLTVYQSNKKEKYTVAMGFQKQIDTTRVGIFFEPVSDKETRITLSSLSSLALSKAEAVIFGGLGK
ncbi:MAG: hypothetical protein WBD24_06095 [Candidatus Omnitrophota bacterium]